MASIATMIISKSGAYLEDGGNILLSPFFFFNVLKPSGNFTYHRV